jgi:hypothetical protein
MERGNEKGVILIPNILNFLLTKNHLIIPEIILPLKVRILEKMRKEIITKK